MSKKSEINALIRLLDDEDETIVENVTERLLSHGEAVVFNLEKSWEGSVNSILQERIENIIHRINFNEVSKKLKYWLLDDYPDLYAGAEIIAKYHYPDLDSLAIKASIEGFKQKIWLELNNDLTPLETVSVFNHVFYGQFGFSGNDTAARSINDYCINHLVETKKGSPIGVGILYVILAQELNIPIYGVNLYNHFVLSYQKKFIENFAQDAVSESMFYINPVNKGSVFGRQDIVQYLESIQKDKDKLNFKPASHKEVIKSLLGYMKRFFLNASEDAKAQEMEALKMLFE